MAEHIVAIFETDAVADAAARELEAAGIPTAAIRRYQRRAGDEVRPGDVTTTTAPVSGGGFWAWLLGEESGPTTSYYPRDVERYEQSAVAGNAVLSVVLDHDSQIHTVVSILETHHPLRMDEDTDELASDLPPGELSAMAAPSEAPYTADTASTAIPPTPSEKASVSGGEEVIPLAEEKLEIGKRMVDHGVTRVRRYVVERPVEQDVTLRGERVTIERRRPIDVAGAPGQAFEERVIEVHETEEVPVVAKTAQVVEEVVVRKEQTERTETVRDTVRREDVEITDEKGRPSSAT